ncbi:MAG: phenylalanine--tRNA ligase subunit beta [Proteobacteria bacterium]|nr:phenylalanine--tRNA ligase subunit beta [Pseudomonadota bacterium]
MKFSEKWLREWVNPKLTTEELGMELTMAGLEVDSLEKQENDAIFEIDLTPNRGDCLSILGVAREVGALKQIPVTAHKINPVKATIEDTVKIDNQAPSLCPRYIGRIIRQIRKVPTPSWIQERLEKSDIRCIHPVVDILNYVMLELGQPMHAFDLNKLTAPIVVRTAKSDEKIKLLDGQEVTLKDDTLVIADSKGPQAIAGVMGGLDSGVQDDTTDILLESALFTASSIAGKARQYGLVTDSSFRFERGVDSQLQSDAMQRATALIIEICGGEPGPIIQIESEKDLPKLSEIVLRYARLGQILGIDLPQPKVIEMLGRIGCELLDYSSSNETVKVKPKSYRYDITTEVDLIEEIARMVGYNNIPNHLPKTGSQFLAQSETRVEVTRLKKAFVDMGYQEVITYSFVDSNLQKKLFPEVAALPLLNPISSDMDEMRLSIWPGLISTLQYNQNRQQQRLKCFEIGLCFMPEGGALKQSSKLGAILTGEYQSESWGIQKRVADFFDLKNHLESLWSLLGNKLPLQFIPHAHPACHPGQCAQIVWQSQPRGWIGKLHPKLSKDLNLDGQVYLLEVDTELLTTKPLPVFARPSRFPEIRRDIAMIVDQGVLSDSLINFVRSSAGEILREVKIFDVYTGKGIDSGRKSIAMGLILQHPSRTLVDEEVEVVIQSVVTGLKKEFSAELRD